MLPEKSPAIVIRQVDFSESSRVVTFFTRDFGKIAALAKGAKRLKSPFEAALDLLTQCEVVFLRKSSSSLDILTEAKLAQRFRPRPGDLSSLYGGYYIAELLDALSEPYDAHPDLFDAACRTLDALSGTGPLPVSILHFEFIILREIGQLPLFDACVSCGQPVTAGGQYNWKVTQGGLVCRNCLMEPAPRTAVSFAAVGALQRASAGAGSGEPFQASPAVWAEIRSVVNSAIASIMGRRPKMLRYLPF